VEPTIILVAAAAVLIVILVYMRARRKTPPAQAALPPELAKPYSNPSGFEDGLADALEKEYRWGQVDRVDDPTWYRKGVEAFEFRKAIEAALELGSQAAAENAQPQTEVSDETQPATPFGVEMPSDEPDDAPDAPST